MLITQVVLMFVHVCSFLLSPYLLRKVSQHQQTHQGDKEPYFGKNSKSSDVVEADSAMLYVLSFIVFTSRGKVITVNALLQQSVIRDNCSGADVKGNLVIMFQNFPSTILSEFLQNGQLWWMHRNRLILRILWGHSATRRWPKRAISSCHKGTLLRIIHSTFESD